MMGEKNRFHAKAQSARRSQRKALGVSLRGLASLCLGVSGC